MNKLKKGDIGIYRIVSPTLKIYIGQSWDVYQRYYKYKRGSCKDQRKIYNSIHKYGWDAHIFDFIHKLPVDATQKNLDYYEIYYHKLYSNLGCNMLNIRECGNGGKNSPETNRLLSIANTGYKHSDNARKKMSAYWTGRKRPELMGVSGRKSYTEAERKAHRLTSTNTVSVLQCSKNGIAIKEWDSISEAARQTGVTRSAITNVCAGRKKSVGGFSWSYKSTKAFIRYE